MKEVKTIKNLKSDVDKLNEAMHKRPGFFKPGQAQPQLINPQKEIDVTHEELDELTKINEQLNKITMNLGLKRQIYLFEEAQLMDAIRQGNDVFRKKMEQIKEKYKVVNNIVGWKSKIKGLAPRG